MLTEFRGNFAHSLEFGHVLQIVIKTIDGASRCRLCLSAAKLSVTPLADIGLNFSVFFRDNRIARNARANGIWTEEEITTGNFDAPTNPIMSGEFFVLYIFCGVDRFHISINNLPYCTFAYRVPISALRSIEIRDQIQAIKQVDHRMIFPSPWPPIHSSDYFKAFSCDTPILFSPGHVMIITARFFGNKKGQGIVKFMESYTRREEIHFSIRFDQKVVVRNSMSKAFEFGPEERHGGFPFVFNQEFKLAIAFTDRECLFAVDGEGFCSYSYRSSNILEELVGVKMTCKNGLEVHVTGVDHVLTHDHNCRNFERFSMVGHEIA